MKKILIIEDDTDLLKKLEFILKSNDYFFLSTISGEKGIKIALKEKPDLIICDLMLPDINGLSVIENIKKNKDLENIPFIFLTANAEIGTRRKGMNLGADDYIVKPFKVKDLLKSIELRLKKTSLPVVGSVNKNFEINTKYKLDEHIFLGLGNKLKSIAVSDIELIISTGNYTNVFLTNGEKAIVRKLIKEWENHLPERTFVKIHRSCIINLNQVRKLEKLGKQTYRVLMKNYAEPLKVSRRNISKLNII